MYRREHIYFMSTKLVAGHILTLYVFRSYLLHVTGVYCSVNMTMMALVSFVCSVYMYVTGVYCVYCSVNMYVTGIYCSVYMLQAFTVV